MASRSSCGLEIIGGKNSRKKGIKILISNNIKNQLIRANQRISSIILAILDYRKRVPHQPTFSYHLLSIESRSIIEKAFVKCQAKESPLGIELFKGNTLYDIKKEERELIGIIFFTWVCKSNQVFINQVRKRGFDNVYLFIDKGAAPPSNFYQHMNFLVIYFPIFKDRLCISQHWWAILQCY